ncbi:MAG: hypothetical protein PHH98_02100 [Candidatus Gracilibacteria bacterium]|nr:hypothetical protein [Candidatus Gracilibacteria bacterium]
MNTQAIDPAVKKYVKDLATQLGARIESQLHPEERRTIYRSFMVGFSSDQQEIEYLKTKLKINGFLATRKTRETPAFLILSLKNNKKVLTSLVILYIIKI